MLDIQKNYVDAGGAFLVGEWLSTERCIIAMGAYRVFNSSCIEIKKMRVDPCYQARGIGTKMLQSLESLAVENGYTEAVLDTTIHQTAALSLYKKQGYEEYKQEIIGEFQTIFMRKKLI